MAGDPFEGRLPIDVNSGLGGKPVTHSTASVNSLPALILWKTLARLTHDDCKELECANERFLLTVEFALSAGMGDLS
jgi:hypothetical protein